MLADPERSRCRARVCVPQPLQVVDHAVRGVWYRLSGSFSNRAFAGRVEGSDWGRVIQTSEPFDDELVRLFELSHDAFCIAGFDGYLKLANPAFARILGYTQEELLARPFMDNVYPDDLESVSAVLAELAAGNDIVGFECREVCADGSVRWFEWNTSTRPEEGFVYGVGRDVTDRRIANDQLSAVRRVATLVAKGVQPQDLFAVVAEEVARVVNVPLVSVVRYEADDTATECASFSTEGPGFPVGTRWSLQGTNVLRLVRATSEAARIDDHSQLEGEIADAVRRTGIRSAVGIPIVVAGRLWGAMVVSSTEPDPLPGGTEARLADFTELLATAIANAGSREALQQLADEQAALRRVATLVARGVSPEDVFAAVAEEVGQLLPVDSASMCRYESDGTLTFVAQWGGVGAFLPVGSRHTLGGHNLGTLVFETGRLARVDGYADSSSGPLGAGIREAGLRSAVGTPVIVEGRLWGLIAAGSILEQPLPADTEVRLASFTELVATAIANAESRTALAASRARIVAAADETRRRIERDLHDGTQQQLVSLMLELRAVQATVPTRLGELEGGLSRIAEGLAGVFDRVREISHGIHPAILSERGLEPALKELARRSAVPVELDSARRAAARAGRGGGVLRGVGGAGQRGQVRARVRRAGRTRRTRRDRATGDPRRRGRGADPAQGSGLVGLSDRIEALGGTLEVTSPAGGGTSLLIEIPAGSQRSPPAPES